MKKNNFKKKLTLNRKTIANLNTEQMSSLFAGRGDSNSINDDSCDEYYCQDPGPEATAPERCSIWCGSGWGYDQDYTDTGEWYCGC